MSDARSELEAFAAYAKALPNNCVLLVDTYNSLEGVRHAIPDKEQIPTYPSGIRNVRESPYLEEVRDRLAVPLWGV